MVPTGDQHHVDDLQMSNLNFNILKTTVVYYTSCGIICQFVRCITSLNQDKKVCKYHACKFIDNAHVFACQYFCLPLRPLPHSHPKSLQVNISLPKPCKYFKPTYQNTTILAEHIK